MASPGIEQPVPTGLQPVPTGQQPVPTGAARARRAFWSMLDLPYTNDKEVKYELQTILKQFYWTACTGMGERESKNPALARKHSQEALANLALHLGVGSACGKPTHAEACNPEPLPPCDRWLDMFRDEHCEGWSQIPIYRHVMGGGHLPSLPKAVEVTMGGRMGPHAMVGTQLSVKPFTVHAYSALVTNEKVITVGKGVTGRARASCHGIHVKQEGGGKGFDTLACNLGGMIRWPPRALRNAETAQTVAAIVETIVETVQFHLPSASENIGISGTRLYWKVCLDEVANNLSDPGHLVDFCHLGLIPHSENNQDLIAMRRRALEVAMVAHMREEVRLGIALEDLAHVIDRCVCV
jgi:hypothetical protein